VLIRRQTWRVMVLAGCLAGMVQGEPKAPGTGQTVVTSKTLEFDYQRHVAIFETNVEVIDPVIRLKSDRLQILFSSSNEVKSVTATGNVNLWHEGSRAVCRKAVYLVQDGEVVLMGDVVLRNGDRVGTCESARYRLGKSEAHMNGNASLRRPGDTVHADSIVFQLANGDIHDVKATGRVRMEHTGTTVAPEGVNSVEGL